MGQTDGLLEGSREVGKTIVPVAPPLPLPLTRSHRRKTTRFGSSPEIGSSCVSTATRDLWERLFDEAYEADVTITTDNGGAIYAHSSIIGMASPVIKNMLKQSRGKSRRKSLSITGVQPDAVRVFIRYLYSSCYEQQEVEEFILHLLVLSHVFVVPQLKRLCEWKLEHGLLHTENVVDIFQLALLCDAPRLSFICHRIILRNLKAVAETEGWKVMKESHPSLEQELLISKIYSDAMQKEKKRKFQERKTYLQLYEAMEALVHICRDGCRTIGPFDKILNGDQEPCKFEACKGLELLVRHLAICKMRIPGSCVQCKRMWQLLELHSRLCADSDICKVPLCRNFKDRISKQNKKYETKWRLLVRNILRVKHVSGWPFFSALTMSV